MPARAPGGWPAVSAFRPPGANFPEGPTWITEGLKMPGGMPFATLLGCCLLLGASFVGALGWAVIRLASHFA
jgi:hypothetical protein